MLTPRADHKLENLGNETGVIPFCVIMRGRSQQLNSCAAGQRPHGLRAAGEPFPPSIRMRNLAFLRMYMRICVGVQTLVKPLWTARAF